MLASLFEKAADYATVVYTRNPSRDALRDVEVLRKQQRKWMEEEKA